MTNKTLSILLPSARGGGAEKAMIFLANSLAKKGLHVDLVFINKVGPFVDIIEPEVNVTDLNCKRTILCIFALTLYLKKVRPIALISNLRHVNIVSCIAHSFSGTVAKLILAEHSLYFFDNAKRNDNKEKIFGPLMRFFYPKANHIVAVSDCIAEDLKSNIEKIHRKISVIHNPIITDDLMHGETNQIPHKWLQDNIPVIVSIGRLSYPKDFFTLIKAFAISRKKRKIKLLILGEGDQHIQLQEYIKKINMEHDIKLLGFVENPHDYLRHASLFVLSSFSEGFGNVVVEAMACGTKVISTGICNGPSEILENGKWGTLVPTQNVSVMSEAINNNLDQNLYPDVRIRANQYHANKSVDKYLTLIF